MTDTQDRKSALDVLVAARALIEKPENWTQGAAAQDSKGRRVHPHHPEACRWCALGALTRAGDRAQDGYRLLRAATGARSIIELNDDGTHPNILAAFDRAIAAERVAVSS
jgi:hypothetical protein